MSSIDSVNRTTATRKRRECYLLLENPSKSNNLGPILRCATAFGISVIVAVGYAKCSTEGSHGASKYVQIINFPTVLQAVKFLQEECQCTSFIGLLGPCPNAYDSITGYPVCQSSENDLVQIKLLLDCRGIKDIDCVTIAGRSFPAHYFPLLSEDKQQRTNNVCIVLSKERFGLPYSLAWHCDAFVHIPHLPIDPKTTATTEYSYDTDVETSRSDSIPCPLSTPACLSIVLHELTEAIGYQEHIFHGHKFSVEKTSYLDNNKYDNGLTTTKSCQLIPDTSGLAAAFDDVLEDGVAENIFNTNNNKQGDY